MKNLHEAQQEFRRDYVVKALLEEGGNQCRAAEILGVHRNMIGRILSENGITMMHVRETIRRRKGLPECRRERDRAVAHPRPTEASCREKEGTQ